MSQLWGSYTPLYASPQQQAGNAPDPRDDVHALGVIGYQMLTGKLDATLGADYAKTLRRLGVPEPLTELLGDCAAHDPDNRPKDAVELAERLGRLAGGPPPAATPGMEQVTCPQCRSVLKVATGETRPVKCGKCGHTFRPYALAAPPPAPPPPAVSPAAEAAVRQLLAFSIPLAPKESSAERPRPTAKPVDTRREREREREREPDDEPRPRREPRPEPPRRKSRAFTYGCLFVLVLGVGVVGGAGYLLYSFFRSGGGGGSAQPNPPEQAAKIEKTLTFPEKVKGIADVAFTADGRRLVTVAADGTIDLWRDDGTRIKSIATGHKDHRPALSPDGTRLAAWKPRNANDPAESGDLIQLFDAATGDEVGEPLVGLDDTPGVLAFTADGRWVLVGGGKTGRVKAWELRRPEKPVELSHETGADAHKGPVTALAVDPKGQFVATAGEDTKVKLWDPNDAGWKHIKTLANNPARPTAMGFWLDPNRPTDKKLIVGLSDGLLRNWDADKGTEFTLKDRDKKLGPVTRVVCSPGTKHVAALDGAGAGWVWEHALQFGQWEIKGHGRVTAVAFAPPEPRFGSHGLMASGGGDGVVQVWELFFNEVRAKLIVGAPVVAVAFSTDGKRLAAAAADGSVTTWSVGEVKTALGQPPVEVR
jgi:WD40 repeat protein